MALAAVANGANILLNTSCGGGGVEKDCPILPLLGGTLLATLESRMLV